MSSKVFKKITVTGCSAESYEKAIETAVEKASESLHNLAWFEVQELGGGLGSDGRIEWLIGKCTFQMGECLGHHDRAAAHGVAADNARLR